ncbi:MAG: hypothetical protein JSV61_16670 [Anaerolineales bacterium]|nr:MAG: hypothetical protein JSV61_16670 [Anaerolineales bacterium]
MLTLHREAAIDSIKPSLNGCLRYRLEAGNLSFVTHRHNGLGRLLCLSIHILEILLALAVIYYSVNGARIAFLDLFAPAN